MLVDLENRGPVAVLTLNNPPVNALSGDLKRDLLARLDAATFSPSVQSIVIAAAGRHFSAGADIKAFNGPLPAGPTLPDVVAAVEAVRKPVVAALHGTVAGGGLELAMACHYRVAEAGARLSLPELNLGIIPGAGGTVRLPRLVGFEHACDIILNGRVVSAEEAADMGLVDEAAPAGAGLARAISIAERVARESPRRTRDLKPPPIPGYVLARFEGEVAKLRGREAPRAALGCLKLAATMPYDAALAFERETFMALVNGKEARALRHVFFAEREAQKSGDLTKGTTIRAVRSVGIVGFGTMGSGIAMAFANAGFPVAVVDLNQEAVDRGLARIRTSYEESRAKGRITEAECAVRMGLIQGSTDFTAMGRGDLVIEAAFEDMEVKRKIFRRLDEVCGDKTILATNTSTLDVNAIGEGTKDPSRVLGLHFFSPANIMKLVEVVRPDAVSRSVLSASLDVVKRIGKIGVVVGVCDGFVGNRMLYAYRRQADFLLEEGALPAQVDRALRAFGMAMGPFQIGDLAGLDIGWRVRKRQAATRPGHLRYSPIADRLCEMGRFGQKTGAGWYRYEKGSRTGVVDPEVDALVKSVSTELGFTRREITDAEIVERCFGALVNEGALLLEEGVAGRASDIDVIWIHGYGFPKHLGGPMHWAGDFGTARIAASVERMNAAQGDLVKPSRLLLQLARDRRTFGESTSMAPC